jgi:hypothetical protein
MTQGDIGHFAGAHFQPASLTRYDAFCLRDWGADNAAT